MFTPSIPVTPHGDPQVVSILISHVDAAGKITVKQAFEGYATEAGNALAQILKEAQEDKTAKSLSYFNGGTPIHIAVSHTDINRPYTPSEESVEFEFAF